MSVLAEKDLMNGDRQILHDAIAIFGRLGVIEDTRRARKALTDLEE